jgi:hypothetical protein
MKAKQSVALKAALSVIACALFAGIFSACETTSGGGGMTPTYDASIYDPWYYGDYHDDVIISPPPGMNDPRPSHPIAMPPSMPSMPRPSPRR